MVENTYVSATLQFLVLFGLLFGTVKILTKNLMTRVTTLEEGGKDLKRRSEDYPFRSVADCTDLMSGCPVRIQTDNDRSFYKSMFDSYTKAIERAEIRAEKRHETIMSEFAVHNRLHLEIAKELGRRSTDFGNELP